MRHMHLRLDLIGVWCGAPGGYLFYLIPKILPAFLCRPLFVVGIPVILATFLFAEDIPNARFRLNDNPGIKLFFFFAILKSSLYACAFASISCTSVFSKSFDWMCLSAITLHHFEMQQLSRES